MPESRPGAATALSPRLVEIPLSAPLGSSDTLRPPQGLESAHAGVLHFSTSNEPEEVARPALADSLKHRALSRAKRRGIRKEQPPNRSMFSTKGLIVEKPVVHLPVLSGGPSRRTSSRLPPRHCWTLEPADLSNSALPDVPRTHAGTI